MQNVKVGNYSFGQVEFFKYLEVNINQTNNKIRLRLISANRGYHTMGNKLSSRQLSR